MADPTRDKPGFFSRLFGRSAEQPLEEPKPADPAGPEAGTPPVDPAAGPAGAPDFANASRDLTDAPPAATSESPDRAGESALAPELKGADLQPIEGFSTEPGDAKPGDAKPGDAMPKSSFESATPAPSPGAALLETPAVVTAFGPLVEAAPAPPPEQRNWWQRLTHGMRRTSSSLSESVTGLFTKRRLDAATLEELEDALVQADLGVPTALRITEAIAAGRYDKEIAPDEVKAILAAEVENTLAPVARPLGIDRSRKPFVILVVGVNGGGKTTTIGKLAQKFRRQGLSVMLAAGDTFRAAAIEQLKVWGQRVGAPVVAREQGSDAAGLAFDALKEARASGTDVLLIDTAGRLQNKAGLMAELEKIVRVLGKSDETVPHATLLVLDATVGQNAISQVELFRKSANVTGLVMTKLDGTARGGILVALAARFGLPVHFIGVGEGVEDLEPFEARDFARAIAGLERVA
jgi:fused signal recognition particle receptor